MYFDFSMADSSRHIFNAQWREVSYLIHISSVDEEISWDV